MDVYYAHSIDGAEKSEWQTLKEHLSNVSKLSGFFADTVGAEQLGIAVGALHDAGKACQAFQLRLEGSPAKVDHSSVGAIVAYGKLREVGYPLAYAVAGHHSGLSNGLTSESGLSSLRSKLKRTDLLDAIDATVVRNMRNQLGKSAGKLSRELIEFIQRGLSDSGEIDKEGQFQAYLLTKILFSCLVDADYLDTERFVAPDNSHLRSATVDSMDGLLTKYDSYMARLCGAAENNELNACRDSVRNQCMVAAKSPQGFFTLRVPTGGGKTLSVVGFALAHAKRHGLQRIVIALPYTNLIEQTADVLRDVFGAQNVLEHHSNYDFEAVDPERAQHERLATQNWDAPIIVTTNVQLFESLFSNKPGKSRKVHNIAKSVLVLDEAQSLPDGVLKPTLAMLEMLVRSCDVTCVLCTATQPYFKDVWPFKETPQEIVADRAGFNEVFGDRTYFNNLGILTMDQLCDRLASEKQALCIVGNKTEARELYRGVAQRLEGGTAGESCFCLSTNKTPDHRMRDLKKIKALLAANRPCHVMSTQLIEAGVDIDFPVVYRELAGVDSLFQAAGRCNREGSIKEPAPVYIFECLKEDGTLFGTTSWLAKQRETTRAILRERDGVIDSGAIEPFFKMRYSSDEELDAYQILSMICCNADLESSLEIMPFATIAEKYRFMPDESLPVFVRWGDEAERLYQDMLNVLEPGALARPAQRFSLNLREREIRDLEQAGYIEELAPFKILNACDGCRIVYDDKVGYRFGEEELLTLVG